MCSFKEQELTVHKCDGNVALMLCIHSILSDMAVHDVAIWEYWEAYIYRTCCEQKLQKHMQIY